MADHTLELSWWLQEPPVTRELPPSSLMSFTKYSIDGEHTKGVPPKQCVIQIGSLKLHLNAKWLPLMMIIQMIQAAALQESISASEMSNQKKALIMLRLMWFYDFLLQRFAQDATRDKPDSSGNSPLPDEWMPESMARCLTRLALKIPHTPAALHKNSQLLGEAYQRPSNHFSYGK
jgi:hypothetical protein